MVEKTFDELKIALSKLALSLGDIEGEINWDDVIMIATKFVVKGEELRQIGMSEKMFGSKKRRHRKKKA